MRCEWKCTSSRGWSALKLIVVATFGRVVLVRVGARPIGKVIGIGAAGLGTLLLVHHPSIRAPHARSPSAGTHSGTLYRAGMSDPTPDSPARHHRTRRQPRSRIHPGSAAVDNSGGIEANEINPDLPLIDPTGGEGRLTGIPHPDSGGHPLRL